MSLAYLYRIVVPKSDSQVSNPVVIIFSNATLIELLSPRRLPLI